MININEIIMELLEQRFASEYVNRMINVSDEFYNVMEDETYIKRFKPFHSERLDKNIAIRTFHVFKQELGDFDCNDPYTVVESEQKPLIPLKAYVGFEIAECLDDLLIKITKPIIDLFKLDLKNKSKKLKITKFKIDKDYHLWNILKDTEIYTINNKKYCIPQIHEKFYFLQQTKNLNICHTTNDFIHEFQFSFQNYFSKTKVFK